MVTVHGLDIGIHADMTVFSSLSALVYNDERGSMGTIKLRLALALLSGGLYHLCAVFHCLGLGKAIKLPKQYRIISKARRHVGVVDS